MFESAELGHKVDKETFKEQEPRLREALLNAQYDLLASKRFPVLILITGVEGAGKGETVNLLNEWMDPRHIQTHGFGPASQEEQERPPEWRYWRALPPKGKVGVFFGSWYTAPIVGRVMDGWKPAELDQRIQQIVRLEQMLTDEGVLLLKFWFHLSKEQQKKRLKKLEKDPDTRWRVTDLDWKYFDKYDDFRAVAQHTLRLTSSGSAPWIVVEGADERYRALTVTNSLLAALRARLDAKNDNDDPAYPSPPLLPPVDNNNLIRSLDYGQQLSKDEYKDQLQHWQGRLNLLSRENDFRDISVVAVFEGIDAAGKGSSIRRVTQALDARWYSLIPIGVPTDEELAQPYLWRFWRHLPRRGRCTIFDRSWYGRVLVERVEGFCSQADWMRAYSEINDFEHQLVEHRTVVAKFWLAITKDEQLARFKAREQTPFKRFKITPDDWRNREKWDVYEQAVCDMIDRTSTDAAPWTIVEANDKHYARINVLRTLCEAIEKAL
jgi:polyphosphate:AMP phosphotransferase